jgi:hypothetical protein
MSAADKFNNFVSAFGAARLLLGRANKEGFLVEGLALHSSLTDAFLRIALVLKRQLVRQNDAVDDVLVSQEPGGEFCTERQIQKLALSEQVIDDALYNEIDELYGRRNAIIHRFFLTPLRYAELTPTLDRYNRVYDTLKGVVYDLENEQIKRGIGMTRVGTAKETLDREVLLKIDPKLRSADEPNRKE